MVRDGAGRPKKYKALTGYAKFKTLNVLRAPNTYFPIRDSWGKPFVYIKQDTAGQWYLSARGSADDFSQPGTGVIREPISRGVLLRVQGRACVFPRRYQNPDGGLVEVALFAGRPNPQQLPNDQEFLGPRGFMAVGDLNPAISPDPDNLNDQRAIARTANRYNTGCVPEDIGYDKVTNALESREPPDMFGDFQWYYTYQGESGGASVDAAPGGFPRYANYGGYPHPSPRYTDYMRRQDKTAGTEIDNERVDVVKVMANTTGVDGGGIVRAIVPRRDIAKFATIAHFGYEDTNAGCRPWDARDESIRYKPGPDAPAPAEQSDPTYRSATWYLIRLKRQRIAGLVPKLVGFTPVRTKSSFDADASCGTRP